VTITVPIPGGPSGAPGSGGSGGFNLGTGGGSSILNEGLIEGFVYAATTDFVNSGVLVGDYVLDTVGTDSPNNFATGGGGGGGASGGPAEVITEQVPGPLPLLGLGAVFSYSRKLRKCIKSSKPEVISTTAV
jgi:hypothetical protein